MKLIIFCEADADFRTIEALLDEILCLRIDWVRDQFPEYAGSVREWEYSASNQRTWFDLHKWRDIAKDFDVLPFRGHLDGKPAGYGTVQLITISQIVRKICKSSQAPPEAFLFVWDMDKQGAERHESITQAMKKSELIAGVKILLACPNPIRETWILAGFEPNHESERAALEEARQALGFWPNEKPHELTAGNEHALHHAKRVLKALGVASWEREQECLKISDEKRRSLLAQRGAGCGLEEYLAAIERELIPLIDPSASRTQ
jgi:hypothetical protein